MNSESPNSADLPHRYEIRFAGQRVRLGTDSSTLARDVCRLYGEHCGAASGTEPLDLAFVRTESGEEETFQMRLRRDDATAPNRPITRPHAMALVRERVQFDLVDEHSERLLFHSAAAARNGRCVLFPASSGSGKTTLAGWIQGQGYQLLSDELLALDASGIVTGFPQALNVKHHGMDVLRGFPWLSSRFDDAIPTSTGCLLPWTGLPENHGTPLALVVFPRFAEGEEFSVTPLSVGLTVSGLLETLLNARNLPNMGVPMVSSVCRGVPGFRVRYGDLDALGAWLDDFLDQPSLAPAANGG